MTRPQLAGSRCQCSKCSERFSSVREFDRHRIGNYAELGQWAHKRRCLTPAEMDAAGWRCNDRGYRMRMRLEHTHFDIEGPCVTPPATHVAGA